MRAEGFCMRFVLFLLTSGAFGYANSRSVKRSVALLRV